MLVQPILSVRTLETCSQLFEEKQSIVVHTASTTLSSYAHYSRFYKLPKSNPQQICWLCSGCDDMNSRVMDASHLLDIVTISERGRHVEVR